MNGDEQATPTDTGRDELNTPLETPVEKVRKDMQELKEANDAFDKERLRAEQIRAERMKGGISNAGAAPKTQEEIDEEAAKKFMQDDE